MPLPQSEEVSNSPHWGKSPTDFLHRKRFPPMTETSAIGGSVQPPMVDGSVPQRGLNPQWGNTSTCSMACSSSRPIASTTWMTCTTICGFLVENMKDLHWLFTNYQGKDSHDFQDNKEYINPAVIDSQQVSSTSSATMRHAAPKRLEIQQRRGFRIEKQATKRGFTSHCRSPGPPLNRRQRQNTTRSDVGGRLGIATVHPRHQKLAEK